MRAKYVIGVDVGGTNTDTALLDPAQSAAAAVAAANKTTTGADITTGIEQSIRAVLDAISARPEQVAYLSIGTTHFINALVEGDISRLERVAVIRLASNDFTASTPSFVDFPSELEKKLCIHNGIISGGLQIDGALIGEIDERQVLAQADIIKSKGIRNVAIIGIYSPIDEVHQQEYRVREMLQTAVGKSVNIVCSRDIAGTGFLTRENATILNGSIFRFAQQTISGFKRVMARVGLTCPLYLTSNSGQLLTSEEAIKLPIRIVTSGPTNSIRGAAFLGLSSGGKTSRYIVDIGGTTTDIGCLLPSGFPRPASAFTEIAGVRVNFAMPQVESVALGGGSIIRISKEGVVAVGPDSVGKELEKRALCFGGDTLTATDIFVASGDVDIGTVVPEVGNDVILAAKSKMRKILQNAVDRMKTSVDPCHVILVGGGAFLCPADLVGVATIERPLHGGVANAIGAAVAEIGAEVEMVVDTEKKVESLQIAKDRAIAQAVSKGAKAELVRIIYEEVSGLTYIEAKCKIRVEVAGPVDYEEVSVSTKDTRREDITPAVPEDTFLNDLEEWDLVQESGTRLENTTNIETYQPNVDGNRIWHVSETDLYFLSIGCYLLGCAGGGTPYTKYLETRDLLRSGANMSIVGIPDLPDDAWCPPLAGVGSPAVGVERPGGNMVLHALQHMERHLDRKWGALLSIEIGGGNGLEGLVWGSSKYYNLPCVDGDLMGRAFPTFEKITPFISAGNVNDLLPTCVADGAGTTLLMTTAKNTEAVDKVMRAAVVTMGSAAGAVGRPLTAAELKHVGIPNTHSLAWRLGRAVALSRKRGTIGTVDGDIIREFGGVCSAGKLFAGKIVDVGQTLYQGHSYGNLVIQKLQEYEDESVDGSFGGIENVAIPFMNENLLVEAHYASGERKVLATVPDLIIVVDSLTGEAVGVPEYRYGLKVFVIVAAAHPLWTSTERALEIVGPKAFGYDMAYQPYGTFVETKSVIDEYAPRRQTCT